MKDLKTIYAEKLKAIKGSLITQDFKDAVYHLPISRTTMDNYLNGDVLKLETAIALYEFLTAKVNDRLKVLSDS